MDKQILERSPYEKRTLRRALMNGIDSLHRVGIESAQLDVQVLICHALGLQRNDLYLQFDRPLTLEQEAHFENLLQRRLQREPVAYITCSKEFWSLDFAVDRTVLIPRPETELLVELAIEFVKPDARTAPVKILDLGTGGGPIAVSIAKELPCAQLWAVDISADALRLAQRNAARHGVAPQITFLEGDLFAPIANSVMEFDLIVANPPYIRTDSIEELAPEIRNYEPAIALNGGVDGLDYYRRIVGEANRYLRDGGSILLEIGADQGAAVKRLFALASDLAEAMIYQDLAGQDRVIAAIKGGAGG
jgi:release factor glutamine methyltransferase